MHFQHFSVASRALHILQHLSFRLVEPLCTSLDLVRRVIVSGGESAQLLVEQRHEQRLSLFVVQFFIARVFETVAVLASRPCWEEFTEKGVLQLSPLIVVFLFNFQFRKDRCWILTVRRVRRRHPFQSEISILIKSRAELGEASLASLDVGRVHLGCGEVDFLAPVRWTHEIISRRRHILKSHLQRDAGLLIFQVVSDLLFVAVVLIAAFE